MADRVSQIMAYEQGELGDRDTVELFADLVRTGDAWRLQGHYGRTAQALIDAGFLDGEGNIDRAKLNEALALWPNPGPWSEEADHDD